MRGKLKMKRALMGLLILVLTAGFLAGGCAKEPTPPPTEEEAVLRISVEYDVKTFDPAYFEDMNDPQMQVAVYEGLVRYKLGTSEIEPALATGWECSDDGLVWRFSLRHGVQFHYGYGELKASDVVFTLGRVTDPELAGTSFASQFPIKSVEAEDDYTVRITLSQLDAMFPHKLAGYFGYIVSEKAFRERGSEGFGKNPVATGPYMFDHWLTGQEVTLVKNDEYWGPEPQLDRVVYMVIPEETTMYNAFDAGDLDMIAISSAHPDKIMKYKNNPNTQVYSVPSMAVRCIGMNAAFKPFDDLRVRQAVAYAIDRDRIIAFFEGTTTLATGFFTPAVEHALLDVWDPVYDPAKAMELLAEAGYPDGFEVVCYTPPSDRTVAPALLVQQDLEAIGIDMEIERQEIGSFIGYVLSGECPMFCMSRSFEPVPDRRLTSAFTSAAYPGDNWTAFLDPDVDEWLAQAGSTPDEEVRDKLLKKVQQRIIDALTYYIIDHENFHISCSNEVKGFVMDSFRSIRLDNVYIAKP